MKINTTKKNSSRKTTFIVLACLILGVIIAALLYVFRPDNSYQPSDAPGQQGTTQNKIESSPEYHPKSDSQTKQDFLDSEKDTSSNPPKNPSSGISEGDISFTTNISSDSVVILTNLSSTPSGTCKLVAKNSAKSVTQTANVMYAHPYSSCEGFTIQKNSLGDGQWSISLSVTSNGSTATTTKEVKVQ